MSDTIDWRAISEQLRAPFDPADVAFRVQGKAGASGKAQVVAYIDARAVQDRLDDVIGAGAWAFDWQPITFKGDDLSIVKGRLTIHGVTREDVGTASNFEPSKGAVSDALKRAAAMWGIGRYLYDVDAAWVTVDGARISDATLAQLRARLPRPDGSPAPRPAPQQTQRPTAPAQTQQSAPAASQPRVAKPTQAAQAAKAVGQEYVTLDDYNPITDAALRPRVKALGITSMADLETWLARIRDSYTRYTRAAIEAELTAMEARRDAANGHDLRAAFPAGQRGA